MLCKLFNDKQLLDIFWQIINSYHKTDGKGVPIGNLTSQYFANHYLAGIDLFIKKELKIKGFVRYMDDFVIWGNEKFPLHQAAYKIEEYLDKKLSLKLKTSYCKTSRQGLPFLGYVLYPYKVLLSKRSKKRFADKMTTFTEKYENGEWSDTDFQTHATAVTVFTQYANAKGFRRRVLSKFKPV